jgi:hypothetical protein
MFQTFPIFLWSMRRMLHAHIKMLCDQVKCCIDRTVYTSDWLVIIELTPSAHLLINHCRLVIRVLIMSMVPTD